MMLVADKRHTLFFDLAWLACALCVLFTGCPKEVTPPAEAQAVHFAGASPYAAPEQAVQTTAPRDRSAERDELRKLLELQQSNYDLSAPSYRLGPGALISEPTQVCISGG